MHEFELVFGEAAGAAQQGQVLVSQLRDVNAAPGSPLVGRG
jgi:hypothetical protein